MFRFLAQILQWIKGWFRQNPPAVSSAPPIPEPELSDLEYENLLLELLEQVARGRSWGQIQGFLMARKLEPEKLARWLRGFGQRWLLQPESHGELAHRLLLLSRIATGELREVARELAEGLSRVDIADAEEEENSAVNANNALLTNTQPTVKPPTTNNSTVESDNELAELIQRGQTYLDKSKYEQARECFEQAVELALENATAWYSLGLSLYSLESYQDSVTSLNRALDLKHNYIAALSRRGLAYKKLKQEEQAKADFEQAITIQPQTAADFWSQGIALDELERYEEGIASYDQALEVNLDSYYAWFNRAISLYELERYEEAVASYDQALKLQPDFYQAWSNRGLELLNLERYEEAVASFDQALKLQPDDYIAWFNRGNALDTLERYEEAVASYDQALQLQPDFYQAWSNRGLALGNLERYEEAVASFDQALQLQPDSYYAWSNRGLAVYYSRERNYSYYQQQFVNLFHLEVDRAAQKIMPQIEAVDPDSIIDQLQASLNNSQSKLLKTFSNCDSPKLIDQINQAPSPELYQLIEQPIPQKLIDFIRQPLSEAVIKQLEQDVLLHPYHFNPQLNLRGYQGQIASLQAELDKAIKKETHPLGWGMLHYDLGKAHYDEGCLTDHPFAYWRKAVTSYNHALSTLTAEDYPKEHLEVLQNLIKGLLGIGETEQAELIRLEGAWLI